MSLTPKQAALRAAAMKPPIPPAQPVAAVTLDDALMMIAPKDTPSRRRRLFHQFMADKIERLMVIAGDDFTESHVETITRGFEEAFRRDGIPTNEAEQYSWEFSVWRNAKTSSARAEAAKAKHRKEAPSREAKRRAKEIAKAANSKAQRARGGS